TGRSATRRPSPTRRSSRSSATGAPRSRAGRTDPVPGVAENTDARVAGRGDTRPMTHPGTELDLEIRDVPGETFAFVVRRVPPGQAGEFIGGAIARVEHFARARGGVVGPPFSISSAPDDEGELAIEAGWPVLPGTEPEPPVEVRTLPPTRALVLRHVGPYEELDGAFYAELLARAHGLGLQPVGGPRERYLVAPGPDWEPVTEVVWPVA